MFGFLKRRGHTYTVLDCETTGLNPGRHDRVIEIALVQLDAAGEIVDRFETLVNPKRDVGRTDIHGITAGDLMSAPEFHDIAGCVIERIKDSVIVGHNVSFDILFLRKEFARLDYLLPNLKYVCTMRAARIIDPDLPGRSLEQCCSHFGVARQTAHNALYDAVATANLFQKCLEKSARLNASTLTPSLSECSEGSRDWPQLKCGGRFLNREVSLKTQAEERGMLARLMGRLPLSNCQHIDNDNYFAFLDRVLEDRVLTPSEAEATVAYAESVGLSRESMKSLNEVYLNDLVELAYDDGVLSELESNDLQTVKSILGVSDAAYASMLTDCSQVSKGRNLANEIESAATLKGKSVCFSGEMRGIYQGRPITRDLAETLATNLGLEVKASVTKKLDILVLADPNSQSSKAKKARDYGTRIVAEAVFWSTLGVG